jgi:cell division protein FtsB
VHQLEQQRGQLQNDIRSLYERTKTLENEVRLLKDDPIYIEHIARKKFRKAKEGEVIYKIVDPADMNSN